MESMSDLFEKPTEPGRYVSGFDLENLRTTDVVCENGSLAIRRGGVRQPLDEADSRLMYLAVDDNGHVSLDADRYGILERVSGSLESARTARELLAVCVENLCVELGCDLGDGSPLSDLIDEAVYNGLGSLRDLLETAEIQVDAE